MNKFDEIEDKLFSAATLYLEYGIKPDENLLLDTYVAFSELLAEVKRCHERLQIDHAYRYQNGELTEFEIPFKDRATFPDKIYCMEVKALAMED